MKLGLLKTIGVFLDASRMFLAIFEALFCKKFGPKSAKNTLYYAVQGTKNKVFLADFEGKLLTKNAPKIAKNTRDASKNTLIIFSNPNLIYNYRDLRLNLVKLHILGGKSKICSLGYQKLAFWVILAEIFTKMPQKWLKTPGMYPKTPPLFSATPTVSKTIMIRIEPCQTAYF